MTAMDTDVNMVAVGESSSSVASSSAKKAKRFEIKKWNAVALWAWGNYLLTFRIASAVFDLFLF